jgi:hypothetical protein
MNVNWPESVSSYLARALVLGVGQDLLQALLGLGRVVGALVKSDNAVPDLDDILGGQRLVDGEAVAAGPLPAGGANPAAADLVKAAGRVGHLVAAQGQHDRGDVLGLESLDELLGKDGAGHGGTGIGSDGVDVDVVLGTLEGQGTAEAEDGAFL